jgi:RNAse (barnase) inhibitor barstar
MSAGSPSLTDLRVAGLHAASQQFIDAAWSEAAGLHFVRARIDADACDSKVELLDTLGHVLAFPEWFGCNWDALADCLTDLSWLPAPGYLLVIQHASAFARRRPDCWETAADVMQQTCRTWRQREVPFWVLTS